MKTDLQYAIERNVATNRRAVENYNLLRQQEQNLAAEALELALDSEGLSNN
jgi:hypothetical protein